MSRVARIASLGIGLALVAGWAQAEGLKTPGEGRAPIVFTVLDAASNAPLPGAKYGANDAEDPEVFGVTDDAGQITLYPRANTTYFSFSAQAPSLTPLGVHWTSEVDQPLALPETMTLALPKGTTIGGKVQDAAGNPVARAWVHILVLSPDRHDQKNGVPYPHTRDLTVKTGNDGRWSSDQIPEEVEDIWLRFQHRDYVSDNMYGETGNFEVEELRRQEAVAILKQGLSVQGRVLAADGAPIAGAEVKQGSDRWGSHYPETATDKDGQFSFKNCEPGPMVLTVQAEGYAPDLKEIDVGEATEPVEFRLDPPQTVRGKIVDAAGSPIEGAFVTADTWRGHRSIHWRVDTDSDGKFEWTNAPADAVEYDMGKEGFMSVRGKVLAPGAEEHLVTMPPELRVSGTVTDQATGAKLDAFTVISGIKWSDDRPPSWQSEAGKTYEGGQYEWTFDYPYPKHFLRVEAVGYKPGISRSIASDEGIITVDFALEAGSGPAGRAVAADGTPLADAQVVLCTAGNGAYMRNGRIETNQSAVIHMTDAEGRFALNYEIGPWELVFVHDSGFARVKESDFTSGMDVVLEPWAQVEGTLMIGGGPKAGENVTVYFNEPWTPDMPQVSMYYQSTTDAEGKFKIERIPAREVHVAWGMPQGAGSTYTHAQILDLTPGATASVTIGGTGRPVVGKLALPEGVDRAVTWGFGNYQLALKNDPPKPADTLTPEEKQAWMAEWQASDEGKAWRRNNRSYALAVNKDGTFRAEDIPPGAYVIRANVYEPPKTGQCGWGDPIGDGTMDFTVPEMAEAHSTDPLDAGTLTIDVRITLEVGQAVPALETELVDGSPVRLADYLGKFVLLDFWATWCGPCRAELPHLQEIYKQFKDRDDFVILGLSLDADKAPLEKYLAENEMPWVHAFLGDWSKTKIPSQFGVYGIPGTFLIDKEGKLQAKDLRGPAMVEAVANALNK